MKILIAGDLVIQQTYNIKNLENRIVALFNQSDLNIINLEAPVSDGISKIVKTGPHLKSDKAATIQVLKKLEIDIVTLANNHVLDYGEKGLSDTIDFCTTLGIQTVGTGKDLEEAAKTLFLDTHEGKIAIINFAENEWASATEKTAGANPMDLIDNIKQIKKAKESADFVFVIVHGGNEYNPYPSPRMVKQYRFYAECGADMVIAHHTHCISGYERYQGVPIFYSLGNFLFTMQKEMRNSWYSGLVLQLEVQSGKEIQFEVIPVSQAKGSHYLSVLKNRELEEVNRSINEINKVIADDGLLKEKWEAFVQQNQGGFIKIISPLGGVKNEYIRAALYRLRLHKLFIHKTYLKETLNRIRCEAHYDVTKQIFRQLLK